MHHIPRKTKAPMPTEALTQTTAPYWYVYRLGYRTPPLTLCDEPLARQEADRMARLSTGTHIVVEPAINITRT